MEWNEKIAVEKCTIVPSLLAANFANLESEFLRLEEGGAEVVHIDVMDGRLVPNISFGIPVLASIRKITSIKLDVHLMIVEPERYLQAFRDAGADSLTIHIEAVPNPVTTLRKIRELGVVAGLAIDYGTPVDKILPYVQLADIILVMGVSAGFGGQTFHSDVLDSIRIIRQNILPTSCIEIDGGMNVNTIKMAVDAGANLVVAGTGVFKASDYGNQISLLKSRALSQELI